jgi:hypothetical protein
VGFRDTGSIRRQFETDGFLSQDSGHLIVAVGEKAIGSVSWHAVHHAPPPWSRCWEHRDWLTA